MKRVVMVWIFLLFSLMMTCCASVDAVNEVYSHDSKKTIPPETPSGIVKNYYISDFRVNAPKISQGIFFINANMGWAVCISPPLLHSYVSNAICKTEDGGQTWRVVTDQKLVNPIKLFFVDPNVGWAVLDTWNTERRSQVVIKTTDGGKVWDEILEVDSPIWSISFIDKKNGVVSARWSPIYRTKDGGKNWKEVSKGAKDKLDSGAVSEGVKYVALLDKKRALGFGGGIWFSEDSGITWEKKIDIGDTADIFGSSFIDSNTGWIVGHNSEIWRTTDGKTWEKIEVPLSFVDGDKKQFTFYRVSFINNTEGWITAHNSFSRDVSVGKLLHTTDGGETWEILYESSKQLGEIKFIDSNRGFAIDSDTGDLLRTSDGGRTWSPQPIEPLKK